MIFDAFSNVPIEKLRDLVGRVFFERVRKITGSIEGSKDDQTREALVECLFAKFNDNPFQESEVRQILFESIDPVVLESLARKYCSRRFNTSSANALALSVLPWNQGNSAFVIDAAKACRIPHSFLPKVGMSSPACEIIDPCEFLPSLFKYQEDLVEIILQQLKQSGSRFLVQLPTGAGKTRVLMEVLVRQIHRQECIFERGGIIVWLAHSEELVEQALETFRNVWENKGKFSIRVNRVIGSYKNNQIDLFASVVFGSLQKLVSLRLSNDSVFEQIKNNSTIVVVDEAHKAIAPTFRVMLNDLASVSTCLIGLTATPGRGQNEVENTELAKYFDRLLITPDFGENAISYLRKQGILSMLQVTFINTGINICLTPDECDDDSFSIESCNRVISLLVRNQNRNKLIVNAVIAEVKQQSPCIVFSCSVEHSSLLSSAFSMLGYKARHIDSSMRKTDRRKAISSFKKGEFDILINYGVLSTGFDSTRIKTVVITRPTSSVVLYSQMIGRGLRGPAVGGSETCKLIDIRDNYINYGDVTKIYEHFDQYWEKTIKYC